MTGVVYDEPSVGISERLLKQTQSSVAPKSGDKRSIDLLAFENSKWFQTSHLDTSRNSAAKTRQCPLNEENSLKKVIAPGATEMIQAEYSNAARLFASKHSKEPPDEHTNPPCQESEAIVPSWEIQPHAMAERPAPWFTQHQLTRPQFARLQEPHLQPWTTSTGNHFTHLETIIEAEPRVEHPVFGDSEQQEGSDHSLKVVRWRRRRWIAEEVFEEVVPEGVRLTSSLFVRVAGVRSP